MEYDLVDDEGILMSDYSLLRRRQNKHIRSRRICLRDSLFVGKKYGAVSVRRHDSIDVGLGSVGKAIDLEFSYKLYWIVYESYQNLNLATIVSKR